MNKLAKLFSVLGTAFALSFATAPASAVMVNAGGVLLDPDYTDGGEYDFIAQFDFTQWYSSNATAPGVVNNYNTGVAIGTVLGSLGGAGATGYYLNGVGEFYRVNSENKSQGGVFVQGGELTLAFGGIGLNGDQTFDLTNAWARVYVDVGGGDYTPPASNQGDVNNALDGATWLDLAFTSLGFDSGSVQNGQVSATFNIVGGTGAGNFLPSTLSYTADAFFTQNLAQVYSNGGNGAAVGNTVPEPASMLLIGAALLGLGALRRKAA